MAAITITITINIDSKSEGRTEESGRCRTGLSETKEGA